MQLFKRLRKLPFKIFIGSDRFFDIVVDIFDFAFEFSAFFGEMIFEGFVDFFNRAVNFRYREITAEKRDYLHGKAYQKNF